MRLWSTIDLSRNKDWISHFISRSHHTLLKFVGHLPTNDEKIYDLPALAHRINTLDISFNSPFSQDFLEKLASTPSWNSENLSIKCTPADPHTKLDISCSSVHNLSLENVSVPWDVNCPNLRQLSLSNLPSEHAPSFAQLHAWLHASQQDLRVISLQHVEILDTEVTDLEAISMPNLQSISLSCAPDVVQKLLGLIHHIPPHAQINIRAYYSLQPLHSITQLLPSPCWPTLTSSPPRMLQLTASEIIADHGRLSIKLHPMAKRVFALGAGLNKAISLEQVSTLVLGVNFLRDVSQDELQGVFEDLGSLHTLTIEDRNEMGNLFSLLAWNPQICPMLQVLRFEGTENRDILSESAKKLMLARRGIKIETNVSANTLGVHHSPQVLSISR